MTTVIGAPTLDDALSALLEIAAAQEERGGRTLVFCEDRLTLLAERAVLSRLGGTFLTEITTFKRYLAGPRVLSKQGSVMELTALIEENAEKLVCFRPRSASAVYETVAQLRASRVDADMLRRGAEETEGTLRGKLSDLALLLEAYEARLAEKGLLDESGYLSLLPEKFAASLAGVNAVFFGFPSLTKQAAEGVRAALHAAESVTGIFLAGKAELYTNEGARIFRAVCEEEGEIALIQRADGLQGEARILRDGLFCPEKLAQPYPTDKIRRFTAQDEAEEFAAVAALVKKHVAEGLRYRDIAVLVADKDSFLWVEKAFGAYRIPYFLDKKRALSAHPFCALTLALLSAVADGVLPDEADAVAANYYFGEGGNYRNYLLKYGGYRGAVRREIKEGDAVKGYDREELAAARERMLRFLACFPRKGKGKDYTRGVRELFECANAKEKTEELQSAFTGAEREFLSPEPLFGVLDEFETVAGERVFTAREFCDALGNGLAALEISMIPQSLDAVFVGDCAESRFTRLPVVFATGLTEDVPLAGRDTAVITDGEMGRLAEIKVEIEPAIAQVNARAREGLGLNLCSFTQALYLSRPVLRQKEEKEGSEILQYAEKLFSMPPMPDLFPYDCCEREPAALGLLRLKEDFETGRTGDVKKYSTLYALLGAPEELLSGGDKERVPEAGKLILGEEASPTLLEAYFECPYAAFTARGLRLREREERSVLDTDAGTFIHAVLEVCAKKFNEFGSEEECRALARTAGEELVRARFVALGDTAEGRYTAERLVGEGEAVAAAAYRQLARSAFRVDETEKKITLPELLLSGKTDRVDVSDDYVRVIDYKTGRIDDSAAAYYTGRKLQPELYLRAAARGKRAAGAFYFPAADGFAEEGEERFRMRGFFSGEEDVVSRFDTALEHGQKSALFDGKMGAFSDRGMPAPDFEDFLDYALLLSARAEHELREGNLTPSPYSGACRWCKAQSLCGFTGLPRKEDAIKCAEIVRIVRRAKGDV